MIQFNVETNWNHPLGFGVLILSLQPLGSYHFCSSYAFLRFRNKGGICNLEVCWLCHGYFPWALSEFSYEFIFISFKSGCNKFCSSHMNFFYTHCFQPSFSKTKITLKQPHSFHSIRMVPNLICLPSVLDI